MTHSIRCSHVIATPQVDGINNQYWWLLVILMCVCVCVFRCDCRAVRAGKEQNGDAEERPGQRGQTEDLRSLQTGETWSRWSRWSRWSSLSLKRFSSTLLCFHSTCFIFVWSVTSYLSGVCYHSGVALRTCGGRQITQNEDFYIISAASAINRWSNDDKWMLKLNFCDEKSVNCFRALRPRVQAVRHNVGFTFLCSSDRRLSKFELLP